MKNCRKSVPAFVILFLLSLTPVLFVHQSSAASCVPPPSGMISWWGGDNNALDMVGTNNGTLMNGSTYAPGMVGQAFSFDGVDDYVNVPYSSSLDLQGSLTISAWINSTNNSSQNRGIAGKAGGYQIYVEAGGLLVFGFYNGTQWTLLHSSTTIPENVWGHVAGTFNSADGTLQLYIDGAPDTSLVTAQRLSADTNPVKIGGFGSDGAPFSGRIDEVEIYNRVLSADEIAAIYNAGSAGKCRSCTPPPPGMVSWWGGDNNVLDMIGTNNATLVNGATYAPGMVSQAFSFDGSGAYAQTPAVAGNLSEGTIDYWVKFNTIKTNNETFGSENDGIVLFSFDGINGGVFTFGLYPGSWNFAFSDVAPVAGQWYHLAATWGPSGMKIYVNGVSSGSDAYSGSSPSVGFHLIGDSVHHNGADIDGLIDELEIFNRALTASEIAAIYNAGGAGKCRSCVAPPADMVSWWKGDGNSADNFGTNHATLMNGATFAPGMVGQAFSFDGVNDYIEVPHSAALNLTSGLTLETWFKLRSGGQATLFSNSDSAGNDSVSSYVLVIRPDGAILVILWGSHPADYFITTAAGLVNTGQWYHVAATWDGTYGPSNNVKLYLNGALVQTWTKSLTPLHVTTQTLTLGSGKPPEQYYPMDGLMDEPEIFNRALSADEIASIYNAGSAGKCFTPDTSPDGFTFTDVTGATRSTVFTSSIAVSGINTSAAISITACTNSGTCEYRINSGPWVSTAGTVNNGDSVIVHQTSSGSYFTTTDLTLSIGGVTDTFSVRTIAAPPPTYNITFSAPDGHGTISCDTPVTEDNDSVCTITPADGYYLYALTDNTSNVMGSVAWGAPSSTYTISGVTGTHDVVATFSEYIIKLIKQNAAIESYYDLLSYAFDAADVGEINVIMLRQGTFTGSPDFNRTGVAITLKGGYNTGFGSNAGQFSTISSSLTITGGTVTIENITVD